MPHKLPQKAFENSRKYLSPPTVAQIAEFLAEIGITRRRFENYYNLPRGTLTHVWMGRIDLPRSYWHIIYEKIVPTYGEGYTKNEKPLLQIKKTKTPEYKPVVNHERLSDIN